MPSEDKATPATGGGSTHHYNFLELGHELLDKPLQSGLELDHCSDAGLHDSDRGRQPTAEPIVAYFSHCERELERQAAERS